MRRFDRSFLEPKTLSLKIEVDKVSAAISAAFADMNRGLRLLIDRQREADKRRMLGDEVYESLYHDPGSTRWQTHYTDQLLGYPVLIDPTIGDGPDVFPCPPPRPAGAPAAEAHTADDAR